MAVPTELPVEKRTLIDSEDQITFCNSPIHLRLQNASQDDTILSVAVYLWIWNGEQDAILGSPNHTLEKDKVSGSDNYINLQIADLLKSYLKNPTNAPNTDQPSFAYNETKAPAITGQGVFWQIQTDITSDAGTVTSDYETNFVTLGYRWNYEQNALGNNGLTPNGSLGFTEDVDRWYNPKIHDYFTQDFNLTNTVEDANTGNMINYIEVDPETKWERCTLDPTLIVFLNKLGLWEEFTPHGKVTVMDNIEFETSNKAFRDPSSIDNSYTHSMQRGVIDVLQSYVINTGSLTADMVAIIEELSYSDKIYLIRFKGDVQTETVSGITVDNTYITVDNTNITVDSTDVETEDLGFFKTHQQIPVVIKNPEVLRKTRLNDKSKIDFNIELDETNNKINNIR